MAVRPIEVDEAERELTRAEKVVCLARYRRTRRIMRGEEECGAPANRRVDPAEARALEHATEALQPAAPWWERLWWRVRGLR